LSPSRNYEINRSTTSRSDGVMAKDNPKIKVQIRWQ